MELKNGSYGVQQAEKIVNRLLDAEGESPKDFMKRRELRADPKSNYYRFCIGDDTNVVTYCFGIVAVSEEEAIRAAQGHVDAISVNGVSVSHNFDGVGTDGLFHIDGLYVVKASDITDSHPY